MKEWRTRFGALILLFAHSSAFAEREKRPDNWRELCRQQISGAYVEAIDRLKHETAFTQQLERKLRELGDEKQKLEKELDSIEARRKKESFQKDLAKRRITAQIALDTINTRISENTKLRDASLKEAEEAKLRQKRISELVAPVFVETKSVPGEVVQGYPIRLDYRQECPKYRFVCPLPLNQRMSLKGISSALGDIESCANYANIQQ